MRIGVIGANTLGVAFSLLCENAGYDVIIYDENEDIENKNAFTNFHEMISKLSDIDRNSKVIKEKRSVEEDYDLGGSE